MEPSPSHGQATPPAPGASPPGIPLSCMFLAFIATAGVAAVATVIIAALLVSIHEHRQEARHPFFRVVELTEDTDDPAVWGKNFPQQYDQYLRTVDMVRTRHGGSEAMPRTPTEADPRSVVARSKLEKDQRLVTMWAGYAFSVDFREARGHAYMLEDQTFTLRQQFAPQPGTCLNCHGSAWNAYRTLGDGDIHAGFEALNRMPWSEAREHVHRPISCIDCHDPETMALRITRPAFMEGIRNYKASQGIRNYDVNKQATRQEMRSYVCAQCHVEYYFEGEGNRLVFPWHKGLKADEMLAYFDEIGFSDWTHEMTGAPCLKVQHPEFELWSQGVHASAGVACADCHMPYTRLGAMKISDHHVRSPILNINNSCQTCHRDSEAEIKARVELIQDRTFQLRNHAMDALMDLIADIKRHIDAGATDSELEAARNYQRRAQFYIDFVESENSMGFHAPQEAARLLGMAIDYCRKGQMALEN